MRRAFTTILLACCFATPALAQDAPQAAPAAAVIGDPPIDAAHPAALAAFVLPSHGHGMNAVMYTAAGAGPHPTLLLLHGFPGNEQNLDLAQAARRAGWNVLTFHYRGSWGSHGTFSFAHCAEDAVTALAFLKSPAAITKYHIDPARIAVAGHSMGGTMAGRAAAADPDVIGTFLIDPADMAYIGRMMLADPKFRQKMIDDEIDGDLPPLSGTSETAVLDEWEHAGEQLDLAAALPALAKRPLVLAYTERGLGPIDYVRMGNAARKAGVADLTVLDWPTDHSFSDHRIALADLLVRWLDRIGAR